MGLLNAIDRDPAAALRPARDRLEKLLRRLRDLDSRCFRKKTGVYRVHQLCKDLAECNGGQPIGRSCKSTSASAKALENQIPTLAANALDDEASLWSELCASSGEVMCDRLSGSCVYDQGSASCRARGAAEEPEASSSARASSELERLQAILTVANDAGASNLAPGRRYRPPVAPPPVIEAALPPPFIDALRDRRLGQQDVPLWAFTDAWASPKVKEGRRQSPIWKFAEAELNKARRRKTSQALAGEDWRSKLDAMATKGQDGSPEERLQHDLRALVHHMLLKSSDRKADLVRQQFLKRFFGDEAGPARLNEGAYERLFPGRERVLRSQLETTNDPKRRFDHKELKLSTEDAHVLEWLLLGELLEGVADDRRLWLDTGVFPAAIVLRNDLGVVKDWSFGSERQPAELNGEGGSSLSVAALYPDFYGAGAAQERGRVDEIQKRIVYPRLLSDEAYWPVLRASMAAEKRAKKNARDDLSEAEEEAAAEGAAKEKWKTPAGASPEAEAPRADDVPSKRRKRQRNAPEERSLRDESASLRAPAPAMPSRLASADLAGDAAWATGAGSFAAPEVPRVSGSPGRSEAATAGDALYNAHREKVEGSGKRPGSQTRSLLGRKKLTGRSMGAGFLGP